jgi:hypothetical protein
LEIALARRPAAAQATVPPPLSDPSLTVEELF